jgi:N-acyl homoserine lactone hydrolase
MLVQRGEWDAGMDPDTAARHGYDPRHFDLGHTLRLLDGERDVFGDGRLPADPRPYAGHQSLRVRLDSGDVVPADDAYYFCRTLRERRLPRYVHDHEAMLVSFDRLAGLEEAGARIFFGHDPEFWRTVPQAPDPVS